MVDCVPAVQLEPVGVEVAERLAEAEAEALSVASPLTVAVELEEREASAEREAACAMEGVPCGWEGVGWGEEQPPGALAVGAGEGVSARRGEVVGTGGVGVPLALAVLLPPGSVMLAQALRDCPAASEAVAEGVVEAEAQAHAPALDEDVGDRVLPDLEVGLAVALSVEAP